MHCKLMTKRELSTMARNMLALAMMMIICVSSVVTVMAKTVEVTIVDNGEETSLNMMNPNQEDILNTVVERQQIEAVDKDDEVSYNPDTRSLSIRRGINLVVKADGESRQVKMHYGDTAGQAVLKAGFTMGENDQLSLAADSLLTENTELAITRYYNVNVTADGDVRRVLVKEGNVASALEVASITLDEEDFTDLPLETELSDGMNVEVSRVTYEEKSKTKSVDYKIKKVQSGELYKGETRIQTKGVAGERTIVYRNKLINGKVVERKELSSKITRKPKDQVVLVGTKARPAAYASISANGTLIDHNGNKVSYLKSYTGRCTAYTGGGGTATGRPAQYGNIAVDPRVIPYGSKLYICSPDGSLVYGYAIAADTGGFAGKGYIMADLYYDTYQQCANFGVRNMTIYVLP